MSTLDFILPDGDFSHQLETIIHPALASLRESVTLPLPDGASLAVQLYPTPGARAAVCICHGFTEFADKYQEILYCFIQAGYAVAICDHRGHGHSSRMTDDPCKVHIESYDTYVTDFDCLVTCAAARFPQLPLLLFGHSMGGCISALYLQAHPECFAGAVLSSPMLELKCGMPPVLAWQYARQMVRAGRSEDCFNPAARDFDGVPHFEGSSCADRSRYDAWFGLRVADPHYQTKNGTFGWLLASLRAQSRAVLYAGQVNTPVLLCRAGQDHLVLPGGQDLFARRAKTVHLVEFPEARHEVFNSGEPIRREFWQEVLCFYEGVLAQNAR